MDTLERAAAQVADLETPVQVSDAMLASHLCLLAEARHAAIQAKQHCADEYAAWKAEHQPIFDTADDADALVDELEETVRNLAVDLYRQTGSKRLPGGVGIRETRKFQYDPESALAWATSKGIALQLDKREFESIMKATSHRPAWVEEVVTPVATIPMKIAVEGGDA